MMDLVTDNQYPVFQANLSQPAQLVLPPDPPHRIMRIAQNEQPDIRIRNLALHVFKIHGITAVFPAKRIVCYDSAVLLNHLAERIINRPLNHDTVAFFRKGPYRRCNREYNARSAYHPVLLHLPAMALLHPARNCPKIGFLSAAVTIYPMLRHFNQPLSHFIRRLPVHIRNPQRNNIFRHAVLRCKIVLYTVGSPSVQHLVKIVSHLPRLSLLSRSSALPAASQCFIIYPFPPICNEYLTPHAEIHTNPETPCHLILHFFSTQNRIPVRTVQIFTIDIPGGDKAVYLSTHHW